MKGLPYTPGWDITQAYMILGYMTGEEHKRAGGSVGRYAVCHFIVFSKD